MPPRAKQTDEPAAPDLDPSGGDRPVGDPEDGNVTLAVRHPHDALDLGPSFNGLVITSEGTEVAADQEQAIRDAAKAADVRIRKVN